jgi:putative membrane protein
MGQGITSFAGRDLRLYPLRVLGTNVEVGSEVRSEEVVPMMFWYGGHWPFWAVGLMWIGMIAFWVLIGWAIYSFVKSVSGGESAPRTAKTASEILDERLALGEIDAEEFGRLRDLLAHEGRIPVDGADRR